MPQQPLILVVEDEALLLKSIVTKLQKEGFAVLTAVTVEEALKHLESSMPPNCIWLDYYLKGKKNGVDLMKSIHVHKSWSKIPTIVVSNTATQQRVDQMLALGAVKYFMKAESLLSDIIGFIHTLIKS